MSSIRSTPANVPDPDRSDSCDSRDRDCCDDLLVPTLVPSEILQSAAFGGQPHLARLPVARSAQDWWRTAVVWGGQGHYARARAALDVVDRETAGHGADHDRTLASLSASTRASLLRQTGRHALASVHDGRAFATVADSSTATEAACDALTGLAADALGCGRLPLGWRLLGECEYRLSGGNAPAGRPELWRQEIRLEWVSAELALAGGDFARAQGHADSAVELSGRSTSIRHRVKSELLRSAALTGTTPGVAVDLAHEVLDTCHEYGLLPLAWAALMLIEGMGGSGTGPTAREVGDVIAVRGGSLLRLS